MINMKDRCFMNSFKSKIMFTMLIICAIALPLIIGASYAIYTIEDTEPQSEEKVELSTSNLEVNFEANEYITNTNGRLITQEEVQDRADFSLFTISNSENTSNNVKYTISISEIETTYDEKTKTYPLMDKDFKWRLVSLTDSIETLVTEGTFEGVTTGNLEITKDLDLYLKPGEEIKYKLYVWLEETTENQNHLLNRTFKSKISVSSILL